MCEKSRYLIEIGTEEMPAAYLSQALKFSKKFWKQALKTKADVFFTCRRIIISFSSESDIPIQDLQSHLDNFIKEIPFQKRMRWDDSGIRFVRPIRWLFSVKECDSIELLALKIGNVNSADKSFYIEGKGLLKQERQIKGIDDYFSFLDEVGVIPDFEKRKELIKSQSVDLAKAKGAEANIINGLLEELAFLAEAPVMFLGHFDERFLALPFDVLLTSMAKNQKLFTVSYPDGKTAPFFIGMVEAQDRKGFDFSDVLSNVDSVLDARLSDALFFWEQDNKAGLTSKIDGLKSIILHEKIGSYYDKAKVIEGLCPLVADMLSMSEKELQELKQSAYLSKADLLSLMVYEFPELEGIMGYYYALKDGLSQNVALAIKEHSLPKGAGDDLPKSRLGMPLAILDKIAHISGFFGAGIRPSGSEDPYGIRRAVIGIIRIIINSQEPLLLDRLFRESIKLWGFNDESYSDIERFFSDRVVSAFIDRSIRRDIAIACVDKWGLDIYNAYKTARALNKMAKGPEFQDALKVLQRVYKITKNADTVYEVDASLFEDAIEEKLWSAFQEAEKEFNNALSKGDVSSAVIIYSRLLPVLHKYFEAVMVNVDDEAVKHNRLAVMQSIYRLFTKSIAKFY